MGYGWCYHQALHDGEVVVDDLGEGCQAVGGAGGVAMETEGVKVGFTFIQVKHSKRHLKTGNRQDT